MTATSAQADIRGLDIDKLAKGFADEEIILKRYVTNSSTSAREIRWYAKTAGFLTGTPNSEAITTSQIANTSFKARPFVTEQSWTRNTSYVRKYFVESPLISDEDIKDSDIDVLATNLRDLVRSVEYQVELRIWDVLTESRSVQNINEEAIIEEWDDPVNCNPINDILSAKSKIRAYSYNPEGAILLMNDDTHRWLLSWLINTKGSSIPAFASQKVESGVVMEILGVRVVVAQFVTADHACLFVPQRAATWKSFMPITARTIEEVGIGQKIRVWEEGEAILTDPKAVCLLSNVGPS